MFGIVSLRWTAGFKNWCMDSIPNRRRTQTESTWFCKMTVIGTGRVLLVKLWWIKKYKEKKCRGRKTN